ncbi:MAG: Do family serine endopeptidase [Vicingaceae bacterium]|nr:Do family serine endopeptidase [Vicingaceae bacterium]
MNTTVKTSIFALSFSLIGGFSALGIYKLNETPQKVYITSTNEDEPPTKLVANYETVEHPKNFEFAAEMSLNAVVHVKTSSTINYQVHPLHQFFYGNQIPQQQVSGAGSGVIISNDGYIVTNNHVIDRADEIQVTLNNKKTYTAKVIGTDPSTDLAVLKIDESNLPFLAFGNSNQLKVGEWVLAVGNPFNLTSTVTAGIVSAKGRDINILKGDPFSGSTAIESFIQTDAAVNPGNSGGALVNVSGELIGINSAIKSNTGSFAGYSFAIPVNIVKKVVEDLKEYGNVQRGFIGINIRNIDEELAKEENIEDLNGVYILDVVKNGSAERAGIKKGDIIKEINNKSVNDVPELQEQLGQFRPGDNINVTILRNKELILIPVTLKNLEGNETIIKKETVSVLKTLGAKFEEADSDVLKKLKLKNGVEVTELFNGKLKNIGVRKGYIITRVNQKNVKTVDELIEILRQSENNGVLMEGVYENGKREFYGFGMK